jgi:hypothetical protein
MSIFHALVGLPSVSAFKFINPNNTLFQSFWGFLRGGDTLYFVYVNYTCNTSDFGLVGPPFGNY